MFNLSARTVFLTIILVVIGVVVASNYKNFSLPEKQFSEDDFTEDIEAARLIKGDFGQLSEFFVKIAEEKSAVYGYELLKRIEFAPTIDQHLLGHVVGDELYKQEGISGMRFCTDDFRNACSHTIVIGSLLEHGLEVFDQVNDVCHQAPGGLGAYTMCFHGFGHGVLAYVAYDMEKMVDLCMRVGTPEYGNQEAYECIGGAVMEMKDGIHDTDLWAAQKDKFIDSENPLAMCQADYMPQGAKQHCYSYITPYMFDAVAGPGAYPTPDIFVDSMAFCELEPDPKYRTLCYRGFGKEFVVLAAAYDLDLLEDLPTKEMQDIISWCDLATDSEGAKACKLEVISSLYWGGENDYGPSLRFCSLLSDDSRDCYGQLIEMVKFFSRDYAYRQSFCEALPGEYNNECTTTLKL